MVLSLPPHFFRTVSERFVQSTEIVPADVAFVFGNKYITQELAAKTAELYHLQHINKAIIVTGGVDGEKDTEAYEIYHALKQHAVPDDFILVEDQSTNTQENLQFGREVLRDKIGMENITSIISLGHAYAGPRFLMCMAKHIPHVLPMHVAVFPQHLTEDTWMHDVDFCKRVQAEIEKIPLYTHMRYIAPVTVQDINHHIREHRHHACQHPHQPL